MSSSIISPFPFFTDTTGAPLESGYIYIGQSNLNPETAPVNVFWDAALTIPAAQPVRTVGGYPSRAGTPSRFYSATDAYSITVRNKNHVLVFSAFDQSDAPTSVFDISTQLITATASQTTFSLTTFTYLPGTDTLQVFRNGLRLNLGLDYLETNSSTVTLTAPAALGDQFLFQGGAVVTGDQVPGTGVSFLQAGAGAVTRNIQDKARESVSVMDFGAVGDGASDDTAAIQAGLNYLAAQYPTWGKMGLYFPSGRYNFTQLTLPVALFYTLHGDGPSSVLVQKGAGIRYVQPPSQGYDLHATIRDLQFDGTDGTGNTLDLSFSQTTDVVDCYFTNVPQGYSALKLDGNPVDGTYSHDFRVRGIRIYNRFDYTKQGFAGIRLGSRVADSLILDFVMQGYGYVDYCLYADAGAVTTCIADSHPFNATKNVVKLNGFNTDFQFTNCVFDNSGEDMVYIKDTSNTRFVNCHFQVRNDWGVTLDGSYNNTFIQNKFNPLGLAIDGFVREINVNGNGNNKVIHSQVENATLAANLFSLNTITSYATGTIYTGSSPATFPTQTFYGTVYSLNGATQTTHPQNATRYLGQNGIATVSDETNWSIPMDGYVKSARIDVNVTPAAGQTFQFALYKGATLIGPVATISNGQYSATITPTSTTLASVSKGDTLYIASTFSATSGISYVRYSVILTG